MMKDITASTQLEFTGERFVPECVREIWHEHWHRYTFAAPYVAGGRVLDVASGEGYGAALLAEHAHMVVGIDLSEQAVRHARRRYQDKPNLHYLAASCDSLPLADGCMDVVVSFETIEHIHTQREMLAELGRVLAADGLLIMSSPNKKTYSDDTGYHNEFHVRELYLDEFVALLKEQFPAVRLLGQKLLFQSALWPLDKTASKARLTAGETDRFALDAPMPHEALYFMAVCARDEARLADLGLDDTLWLLTETTESVYRDYQQVTRDRDRYRGQRNELRLQSDQLREHRDALEARRVELEALAHGLFAQRDDLQSRNAHLETELFQARHDEERLRGELAHKDQSLAHQAEELAELRRMLAEIHASTIWRWSRPYVRLMSALRRRSRPEPPSAVPAPRFRSRPVELRVDVIVPVYRGLTETRTCLDSLLAAEPALPHECIVIDDASPEPALSAYLLELAQTGKITLLVNPENLGFVGTVNRGMTLHPEHDVVLLNSDTRVSGDWLDRLADCAYSDPAAATATPLSNNATICSYPRFCEDNPLPGGASTAELDALCRTVNPGRTVEIPTAVGFCMYIRRDCLDQLGLFDAERFGKGYGEENDFCMRAGATGWKHLLCADTFVYHSGGVSFAETQSPRQREAIQVMRRLHPHYETQVQRHILADPARPLRLALDAARLLALKQPLVLFVLHASGGGTEKHARDLARLFAGRLEVLLLQPGDTGYHELSWLGEGESFRLYFRLPEDYPRLRELLRGLGLGRVHFHHLQGIDPALLQLPDELGLPYDFTVHDYYILCPQISLTGVRGQYCGEPDEAGCNRCLRLLPAPGKVDIGAWRRQHATLVDKAARVFAPSRDVEARVLRHFPRAEVIVAPHPEEKALDRPPTPRSLAADQPLRIAVLGALGPAKGPDLLERCALDAEYRDLPLDFQLLGYAYRTLIERPRSRLTVHGAYQDDELDRLLGELKPHLVWFPAQCPETYSYTLSACLRNGLPVVAPNLGAFPERLAGRAWSWIRPWREEAGTYNDFFMTVRAGHFATGIAPRPPAGEPSLAAFHYQADYPEPLVPPDQGARADLDELRAILGNHAYPRATDGPPLGSLPTQARLLPLIRRLRAAPVMRWVVRGIPLAWQTRWKYWFLGRTPP